MYNIVLVKVKIVYFRPRFKVFELKILIGIVNAENTLRERQKLQQFPNVCRISTMNMNNERNTKTHSIVWVVHNL